MFTLLKLSSSYRDAVSVLALFLPFDVVVWSAV